MKSFVNTTEQIDDLPLAAEELLAGVSQKSLQKNTVGILYCYSDMEIAEFAAVLSQKAEFPILGCTAIATMEHKRGFHEMAASLMILTSDDCSFSLALSDPITPENVAGQIDEACNGIKAALGEELKLLFALPPYLLGIMLDEYASGFNRCCPGTPVLGGLPSYNATGDRNLTVFCGEKVLLSRKKQLMTPGELETATVDVTGCAEDLRLLVEKEG